MKVTACTNLFSHLYFCQSLVLSPLTLSNLNFKRNLIRINLLPRSSELQVLGIWRRSSELLVFRIFGTWSSESSSPQKLETFIRTSGLQNLWNLIRIFKSSEAGDIHQNFRSSKSLALDQKRNIRSWDCSSDLLVSESSTWFLGKLSESSEADLHQNQKQCLQKRIRMESFRLLTSDELFFVSESESVCELKQQTLEYQNCSFKNILCYHQNLEI